jgi:hypothetical protein
MGSTPQVGSEKKLVDDLWWIARYAKEPDQFSVSFGVGKDTGICQVCWSIFCGERELDKQYAHHRSWMYLQSSAEAGCRLCSTFCQLLTPEQIAHLQPAANETGERGTPILYKFTSPTSPSSDQDEQDVKLLELRIQFYTGTTLGPDQLPNSYLGFITLLPAKCMCNLGHLL